MLTKYVCEYCGMIYKTKREVLACEREARELKPKFKVDDILHDVDYESEKFKVLKVLRWQPDFDKIFTVMIKGDYQSLNIPLLSYHTFVYVLRSLEDKNKKHDFTKEVIFSYNRVKHGISIGIKGIALKDEIFLSKDSN